MKIIFQFNSQSRGKWIPEAIEIAKKRGGKLIGKDYQVEFTSTRDKDLSRLDFMVGTLKASKLFIDNEKYQSPELSYLISLIFNCEYKDPNSTRGRGKKMCSGKCIYNNSQDIMTLAERFCEILNPVLKEDFPDSFPSVDYQEELNLFHFNIENLEWLYQIGLAKSTDKIDSLRISELQKDTQIFEHDGNFEKAIGKYVEILKIDWIGGNFFDWNLRWVGGLFLELERYEQAIEVYKRYLEFYPDDDEISNLLNDLYETIGTKREFSTIRGERLIKKITIERDEEIQFTTIINDKIKENYLDFLKYHKSILEGNLFKKKFSVYKEVVKTKSHTVTAWKNLAYAYLEKRDFQNAIKCFERAIELGSKAQDTWMWCAGSYTEIGDYEKSVELYKKMLNIIDYNYFRNYIFQIFYCFEKVIDNQTTNKAIVKDIIDLYEQLKMNSMMDEELKSETKIVELCIDSIKN